MGPERAAAGAEQVVAGVGRPADGIERVATRVGRAVAEVKHASAGFEQAAARVGLVAALPMYDFPELRAAHDSLWSALAVRLEAAGLGGVPRVLTRDVGHLQAWGHPSLLLAQACEYPLAKSFADSVRVVANPVYAAEGCERARYRSAIVVRAVSAAVHSNGDAAHAGEGAAVDSVPGTRATYDAEHDARHDTRHDARHDTRHDARHDTRHDARHGAMHDARHGAMHDPKLATLRGARCVVNELSSNSGMNLLRAAVAPFATNGQFFASVAVSGSHLRSVEMIVAGEADVAAIDCVSFAHFQRLYPSLVSGVKVLSWTASSPSLPFITSRSSSEATVQALRAALAGVFEDTRLATARDQLLLKGIDLEPEEGFEEVLALERGAARAGYATLA